MFTRIKDLRDDKDLSQKDLAKYLNCTQVCYSRYELGLRNVPIEVLKKLASLYNVSVDYLIEITDEKKPYPKPKTR